LQLVYNMAHTLIIDIGKTNKKALVFDQNFKIVHEVSAQIPETVDEDGFPCEDLEALENWIEDAQSAAFQLPGIQIEHMSCTAYGASLVHLDADGMPIAPLYNYLKPFPPDLLDEFLAKYGPAEKICLETASPLLGNLNSGLQLYWLKHRRPHIYEKIKYSLHLPEWVSRTIGGSYRALEVTSLGCHTLLTDVRKGDYHHWVKAEGLTDKLTPIPSPEPPGMDTGLHDSSSALYPYLCLMEEPFLLISTGTWCISMNPFNDEPLTLEEMQQDCLYYIQMDGTLVKSARYFGGNEHEEGVKKIAEELGVSPDFYQKEIPEGSVLEQKYDELMRNIVEKQAQSTRLALGNSKVKRLIVDGGFAHNSRYLRGLANAFPHLSVYAAEVPHASALGAALYLHTSWTTDQVPEHMMRLQKIS